MIIILCVSTYFASKSIVATIIMFLIFVIPLSVDYIIKIKKKRDERKIKELLFKQEQISKEMSNKTLYKYNPTESNRAYSYYSNEKQTFAQIERSKMSYSLRYQVLRRDGFKCQICGRTQNDGVILHVDHIKPVSKGGKTELNNLRTLCDICNLGKGAKYDEHGLN